MSKLIRAKSWVTLDAAASHLSAVLSEAVSRADVLQLGLEGKLTLSVQLVNGAKAQPAQIVSRADVNFKELPCLSGGGTIRIPVPDALFIDSERAIRTRDELLTLDGIYDLPLLGGERLDVEYEYQQATSRVEVTKQTLDGTYLVDGDGRLYRLLASIEENELCPGSLASGRAMLARIAVESFSAEQAAQVRALHHEARAEFLKGQQERRSDSPTAGYYPAGGLPSDTAMVVRTSALNTLCRALLVDGGGHANPEEHLHLRWTPERLKELRTYREAHGTKQAAAKFGISTSRVRELLPKPKPATPFSSLGR